MPFITSDRRDKDSLASLKTGPLVGVVLAWLVVGAGVVFLVWTLDQRQTVTADWPSVTGTMLESRVESSIQSGTDRTYTLAVRYEYEVNGLRFENDDFTRSGGTISSSKRSTMSRRARLPRRRQGRCALQPREPGGIRARQLRVRAPRRPDHLLPDLRARRGRRRRRARATIHGDRVSDHL
jgi:hypothetical protein